MIRCKLGWHDYTWKRESYEVREFSYINLFGPPITSVRHRQIGTCSRCNHAKVKSL